LYDGVGDTKRHISGTNTPWTVGLSVTYGDVIMTNDDVIDLYQRVSIGADVIEF
jgi:lipoprotein-anchoring transpeptidase ErfK/SrfK